MPIIVDLICIGAYVLFDVSIALVLAQMPTEKPKHHLNMSWLCSFLFILTSRQKHNNHAYLAPPIYSAEFRLVRLKSWLPRHNIIAHITGDIEKNENLATAAKIISFWFHLKLRDKCDINNDTSLYFNLLIVAIAHLDWTLRLNVASSRKNTSLGCVQCYKLILTWRLIQIEAELF